MANSSIQLRRRRFSADRRGRDTNTSSSELERAIGVRLSSGYLRDPRVSVEVIGFRPFYILGEVAKPGEYPYASGPRRVQRSGDGRRLHLPGPDQEGLRAQRQRPDGAGLSAEGACADRARRHHPASPSGGSTLPPSSGGVQTVSGLSSSTALSSPTRASAPRPGCADVVRRRCAAPQAPPGIPGTGGIAHVEGGDEGGEGAEGGSA